CIEPFVYTVVSRVAENGAVVCSEPSFMPSTLNCTPAKPEPPTLSAAVAAIVALPPKVAPFTGDVMETVGAVTSAVTPAKLSSATQPLVPEVKATYHHQ